MYAYKHVHIRTCLHTQWAVGQNAFLYCGLLSNDCRHVVFQVNLGGIWEIGFRGEDSAGRGS